MSVRLKFIVAYDGGPFAGWQSQAHGNAIQDHLERAFGEICGVPLQVFGSGRTDAGVHAVGQCAHVDVPDRRFSARRWLPAINAGLPPTIRVLKCGYVPDSFHARFSAVGKVYRYRVWNASVLPPLEWGRAWHVTSPLNYDAVAAAANLFEGEHDFAGFTANNGTELESTVRTIQSVRLARSGSCLTLTFDGNGFLYKMVRLLVGAIVQAGRGRDSVDAIRGRLRGTGMTNAKPRLVAAAGGLNLLRVRY